MRKSVLHMQGEIHAAARLSLLGEFTLSVGAERVDLPLMSQRLIAMVALSDKPLARGRILGILWPDTPETQAAACLRTAIWRSSPGGCVLSRFQDRVGLASSVISDVAAASVIAAQLGSCAAYLPDLAGQALLGSDLLSSWGDEWLIAPRERIRNQHVHALEQLCVRLVRIGRYDRAIDAGLAAVQADPLRDKAHAVLIRAYLADGHRARALRHFRAYAAMLDAELGIPPDPELENLLGPLLRAASSSRCDAAFRPRNRRAVA
jgi:DNA-binding SARP family transcriptional activator